MRKLDCNSSTDIHFLGSENRGILWTSPNAVKVQTKVRNKKPAKSIPLKKIKKQV